MIFQLFKLEVLKSVRSVSLSRNVIGGIFLAIIGFFFLINLLFLAFFLDEILVESLGAEQPAVFLNGLLFYYFVFELMVRFFMQKMPVMELEHYLHLPVRRSTLIHYLLGRSKLTPLTMLVPLIFAPFAFTEVASTWGAAGAWSWLLCLWAVSLLIHWFMLWYKQRLGSSLPGIIALVLLPVLTLGAQYYGLFNAGQWAAPFWNAALEGWLPVAVTAAAGLAAYVFAWRYYRRHAYTEELGDRRGGTYVNRSIDFFSRFGRMGEMADLEWKLILRHKKSRIYLLITGLFLLYGLIFYGEPAYQSETGVSWMYIFLGVFITGIFIMQYGQLFLSWNSSTFDFYMTRRGGLDDLVRGKYLLFYVITVLCYLLSIPYVYFGWDVLLVHTAAFFFNMGVTIHLIVWISLWKPKPMDLSKGAMFNYEGIGAAQFVMIIPMIAVPYAVFIPFSLLAGDYIGLTALGVTGLAGLLFSDKLTEVCVRRLTTQRHEISSSFRQEI
ncbi:MAG: DUF5687 family protein [Balneolaceae bacterium]|nr:DUF5687 family protein [Balneolaceae bacterium]